MMTDDVENHLRIDLEWRSTTDIKTSGIYRVVEDERSELLCYAARYKGRSGIWQHPDEAPDWLLDALADEDVLVYAHNAAVERLWIQRRLAPEFGWPKVSTKRFRCTASRLARLALPRALDKGAIALGLEIKKDDAGKKAMLKLSKPVKPRTPRKNSKKVSDLFVRNVDPNQIVFHEDEALLEKTMFYCDNDVEVEDEIVRHTYAMPDSEERYYQLTERINDFGVRVDLDLVHMLIEQAQVCIYNLNTEISRITGGAVRRVTNVEALKKWIKAETNVQITTLRKEDIDDFIEDNPDFPKHVRRAIQLRQEGAKSSVAKLNTILARVSRDGRLRGAFVHHGASTGRYTSMGVQLQNLVREVLKDLETRIKDPDSLTLPEISACLRACFIPSAGHVFIDADYNAIEARGVGWLAGAKKLLKIYCTGGDPYCEMASAIFGFVVTKEDEKERFVGKQTILGCGYGMGWAKFLSQCEKFRQPVTEKLAKKAVGTYRDEYHEIQDLWYEVGNAAIKATRNRGHVVSCANGKLQFLFKGRYLRMRLPSGRILFYRDPEVRKVKKPWGVATAISFMAQDGTTKRWMREFTWGGKLVENAVQAICRDLLFEAMDRLEKIGIRIVLSVHDQLVFEVLKSEAEWARKIVKREMERVPDWAEGFPIFADPKMAMRFGK